MTMHLCFRSLENPLNKCETCDHSIPHEWKPRSKPIGSCLYYAEHAECLTLPKIQNIVETNTGEKQCIFCGKHSIKPLCKSCMEKIVAKKV